MNKKLLIPICCVLFSTSTVAQSVGINNNAPHSSAALDITSDTKGLLIPRMSTAQRKVIAGPAAGLLVFDLDKSTIYLFDGQKWQPMLFNTSDANNPPIARSSSDGSASDKLGISVSMSGDYAIIGAYYDDIDANTDQGSAYIFMRVGGTWTEQAKLIASDGKANDHFGNSVSISGDYAVVGAPNGSGDWFLQGAAYIFVRSGANWSQQAKLSAADGAPGDFFGTSVSISGDDVIVGAPNDGGLYANQGSAYIFVRNGVIWPQQSKLTYVGSQYNDNFGYSVSISGDYAIVGALYFDWSYENQGSAYIFMRSGSVWTQQVQLVANDGDENDAFGYSVSISGEYAIVGAPNDDGMVLTNHGSTYIFKRSGASWQQQAKLGETNASETYFGNSVSINGDYAIVGSFYDNIGSNSQQGSAFIYLRSGTTWSLFRKVDDGSGQKAGLFGSAVAVSGFNYMISAVGKNNSAGEVSFLNIE